MGARDLIFLASSDHLVYQITADSANTLGMVGTLILRQEFVRCYSGCDWRTPYQGRLKLNVNTEVIARATRPTWVFIAAGEVTGSIDGNNRLGAKAGQSAAAFCNK